MSGPEKWANWDELDAPRRVTCGVCGRRRDIMHMWVVDDPRDGTGLLVCEDRGGCLGLYRPLDDRALTIKERNERAEKAARQ